MEGRKIMGYRYHLAKIPKAIAKELHSCKTEEEVLKVCDTVDLETEEDDEDEERRYLPIYEIGEDIFDLGPDITFADEIIKNRPKLLSEEIETYSEYDCWLCEKADFINILKGIENIIKNNYSEKLNGSDKERLSHIYSYNQVWNNEFFSILNLDENNMSLTHSSLWEHQIFDLLILYKTFDFENYNLLFLGW